MNTYTELVVTRNNHLVALEKNDYVLCEHVFSIFVNGNLLIRLLCTPQHLEELATGHLLSEGLINSMADIESMQLSESTAVITLHALDESVFKAEKIAGTGLGRPYSIAHTSAATRQPLVDGVTFELEKIWDAFEQFQEGGELFGKTGGAHSCCLFDGRVVIVVREDIGRHNAFDKVLGYSLLHGIDLSKCCLLTSGRLPSDMVQKAINTGLPALMTRAATTDEAVAIARKYNLTLAGFARQRCCNIYAGQQRFVSCTDSL